MHTQLTEIPPTRLTPGQQHFAEHVKAQEALQAAVGEQVFLYRESGHGDAIRWLVNPKGDLVKTDYLR